MRHSARMGSSIAAARRWIRARPSWCATQRRRPSRFQRRRIPVCLPAGLQEQQHRPPERKILGASLSPGERRPRQGWCRAGGHSHAQDRTRAAVVGVGVRRCDSLSASGQSEREAVPIEVEFQPILTLSAGGSERASVTRGAGPRAKRSTTRPPRGLRTNEARRARSLQQQSRESGRGPPLWPY